MTTLLLTVPLLLGAPSTTAATPKAVLAGTLVDGNELQITIVATLDSDGAVAGEAHICLVVTECAGGPVEELLPPEIGGQWCVSGFDSGSTESVYVIFVLSSPVVSIGALPIIDKYLIMIGNAEDTDCSVPVSRSDFSTPTGGDMVGMKF